MKIISFYLLWADFSGWNNKSLSLRQFIINNCDCDGNTIFLLIFYLVSLNYEFSVLVVQFQWTHWKEKHFSRFRLNAYLSCLNQRISHHEYIYIALISALHIKRANTWKHIKSHLNLLNSLESRLLAIFVVINYLGDRWGHFPWEVPIWNLTYFHQSRLDRLTNGWKWSIG